MLRSQVTILCILCGLANFVFGTELPHYIKPCSLKDVDEFNKCFVKHGNEAIPALINGDKKLKLPRFDPLKIDSVTFSPSPQLTINVRNLDVFGLKASEVRSGRLEVENGKMIFQMFVPNVTIVGDYVAKGRILIVPLEGNGKMNMQMINVIFNYTIELENMRLDSNETVKLKSTHVSFYQDDVRFNFENLFNGNKLLSEETNKVLTENWRAVHEDLSPVFGATIDQVIKSIVVNTLEKFYFREAFLP